MIYDIHCNKIAERRGLIMLINHINIMDTDGKVYCKKLNKVTVLNFEECNTCDMFNGSAQGEGIECLWEDKRTTAALIRIDIPELELEWVNQIMKKPENLSFSKK